MAVLSIRFLVLAVFAVAGILISGNNNVVLGQGADNCQGDMDGLIAKCGTFFQKTGATVNPSQECCNVVSTVNVPCVCGQITKEIEQMIDMEKVVFVAQFCGKPLDHGMKCGSYTVPSRKKSYNIKQ